MKKDAMQTNEKATATAEAAETVAGGSEQADGISNIYDSVFRTVIEYFPELIIPVINEIFKTHYPMDENLTVLKNEHVTWRGRTVTDLFFDLDGRYFHVECQSTTDGRMLIRIMEYAASIAIEHAAEEADGSFRMKFPSSCVIYLRSTKNTPDALMMHVDFPNGESAAFNVPVLKVKEYTKDELFQKELLMLLPYYLMRYEDECKEAGKIKNQKEADRRMETFMAEYKDVISRLAKACAEKEQRYLFNTLADLIIEMAEYLAPENEKGRVKAVEGTIIRTRTQILMEESIAKGEAIGEARGRVIGELETLVSLVRKGIITLTQAAEEHSLSEEDFLEQCRELHLEI